MRYSNIIVIGSVLGDYTSGSLKESVRKGVIRHFDHISDLPSTQWYRVPQKGQKYSTFAKKQYENSKACNQSLDDVEYEIADDIYTGDTGDANNIENWFPRKVSNLNWPQMDGSLVRNIYPTYLAIHGGKRQFCFLRKYLGKSVDGSSRGPYNREWGPYRCSALKMASDGENPKPNEYNYGQYQKFIALRSGPEIKYKPVINLVDIRGQADYFGPMYQRLDLDTDDLHPVGKWENSRPITNYTRNEIIEKYNVIKFYNSEHELFNDNSRLRLVGNEPVTMTYCDENGENCEPPVRKGLMTEVDTMMPTYTFLNGGPYDENLMSEKMNKETNVKGNWFRRNMVPNYISRSFKSGFMRTGSLIGGAHHKYDRDLTTMMDQPGGSRYCCTNSVSGYEGYNTEDTRKKGVGYMYQPSFAPFWLYQESTTCDEADTYEGSCQEVYTPLLDFNNQPHISIYELSKRIQLLKPGGNPDTLGTSAMREYRNENEAREIKFTIYDNCEQDFWVYFYTGNQNKLIEQNFMGDNAKKEMDVQDVNHRDNTSRNKKNSDFWSKNGKDDMKMFMSNYEGDINRNEDGCPGNSETSVTVTYTCSKNQSLRNIKEKEDAASFVSSNSDYQDDWTNNILYSKFIEKKLSGSLIDIFENDLLFNDFDIHPPRFLPVNCDISLFGDFCVDGVDGNSPSYALDKCKEPSFGAACVDLCSALNASSDNSFTDFNYYNDFGNVIIEDDIIMSDFWEGYYTPPGGEKQACDFNVINPNGVDLSYAYNHYYDTRPNEEFKHTIKEIKQETEGDCSSIKIEIEADCGWDNADDEVAEGEDVLQETNYWDYQKKCVEEEWDSIYDTMFPYEDLEAASLWSNHIRSEGKH